MKIRFVEEDDCEKLLSIYAQYINTSITFECDLQSTIEFSAKINKISNKYPWLVIENDKDILGYAYAHEHDERQAYQWNAELTIYLDKAESGKKFGRRLYFLLENILRTQGIISLYARITIPNPASFGLHEAMGFKLNHILRKCGFKAGKWHDVACLVKDIAPHSEKPLPVIPFSELDAKILAKIMSTY